MKDKVIKLSFPLPFHVPVEEEITGIINYENSAAIKFRFEKFENKSLKAKSELEEFCSIIKVEFISNVELNFDTTQELIGHAVKFSIIALNDFLDSLRLKSSLNFIKNFNITDLPPYINIEIDSEKYPYFTTPTTIILKDGTLPNEVFIKTLGQVELWYENPHFEVVDKFLSRGIHHLYTEQFTFAIIELNTSFETYIRLCQKLILVKQGKSDAEIEQKLSISFRNTIEDHLGPALSANLKFKESPVMKDWYDKLYSLRNKIVHSGHSYISGDEAYDAYDSLQNTVNYITDLMVNSGFMEEEGKVKIEDLNKNTPDAVDKEELMKKLKDRGFF